MRTKQENQAVERALTGGNAIGRVVSHQPPQNAIELWGEVGEHRHVALSNHVLPVEDAAADVEELVDHSSHCKRVALADKQGEVTPGALSGELAVPLVHDAVDLGGHKERAPLAAQPPQCRPEGLLPQVAQADGSVQVSHGNQVLLLVVVDAARGYGAVQHVVPVEVGHA